MKSSSKFQKLEKFLLQMLLCGLVFPALADQSSKSEALLVDLPLYQTKEIKTAKILSVGSDSMGGLMKIWVDAYRQHHANVSIQILNRGSAAAPAALIEGAADLGPMARPMKSEELEKFQQKYGFSPTQLRIAIAPISVYASATNPISQLSLSELDAAYSSSRKRGLKKRVEFWKDLGVSGDLAEEAIFRISSSKHGSLRMQFRQKVLLQGDYSEDIHQVIGADALIAAIKSNKSALAYGPWNISAPEIKTLAISKESGEPAVSPTYEDISNEKYPLSRYLNLYIVNTPGKPTDPTVKDFLEFILSKEGQEIALANGMLPLAKSSIMEELSKLN